MINLKNDYIFRVQFRDWLPEILLMFTGKFLSIGTKNNKLSFVICYHLHVWIKVTVEGNSKNQKQEQQHKKNLRQKYQMTQWFHIGAFIWKNKKTLI